MSVSRVLGIAAAAAMGAVGPSAAASEPASFIARVEQSLGITPRTEDERAVRAAAAPYGEPASFIARVELSLGVASGGAPGETPAISVIAPSDYGEPASFITRVQQRLHPDRMGSPDSEDRPAFDEYGLGAQW